MQKVAKALVLAGCAGLPFLSTAARAADEPPVHSFTGKVALYSEYEYRGIGQTAEKPALQLNLDYAHKSGFYVGTWASSIKWIEDNSDVPPQTNIDGPVEVDFYGGYKFSLGPVGLDAGVLRYQYVSNNLQDTGGGGVYKNANTTEVYLAGTIGPVTAKYSHALTNLFGNYNFPADMDTKGSSYFDVTATF